MRDSDRDGDADTRNRGPGLVIPSELLTFSQWVEPLRSTNHYGLFAVMTTTRPEIIVEGSDDGVSWKPYRFRWKPCELDRRPRFAMLHMPRLDWQMWFAALAGDCRVHSLVSPVRATAPRGFTIRAGSLAGKPIPGESAAVLACAPRPVQVHGPGLAGLVVT